MTDDISITYPWVQKADDDPPFIPLGAGTFKPKPMTARQITRKLQAEVDGYLTVFDQRLPEFASLLDSPV